MLALQPAVAWRAQQRRHDFGEMSNMISFQPVLTAASKTQQAHPYRSASTTGLK